MCCFFFFFQAEDGIRDAQESRGLGDVYKRQPHITTVAKAASKKLGVLFRLRDFFSSSQLIQLYKGLIRPCMEYCSHIWGGSGFTRLLDRVESKAKRLINCSVLSS